MAGKLRITGGHLSRRLFDVPSKGVRPTADKTREALFSVLGDVEDLRVLDLCAGSGALAFEALSRGAKNAVLVEKNKKVAEQAKRNACALDLSAQVQVVVMPSERFFSSQAEIAGDLDPASPRWDLIFLDPPYDDSISDTLWHGMLNCLAPGGRIVVERRARTEDLAFAGLGVTFARTWGEASVRIYCAQSGLTDAQR